MFALINFLSANKSKLSNFSSCSGYFLVIHADYLWSVPKSKMNKIATNCTCNVHTDKNHNNIKM